MHDPIHIHPHEHGDGSHGTHSHTHDPAEIKKNSEPHRKVHRPPRIGKAYG